LLGVGTIERTGADISRSKHCHRYSAGHPAPQALAIGLVNTLKALDTIGSRKKQK